MSPQRVVVENTYGDSGRVIEQKSQGDAARLWKLYYTGRESIEEDPQGGRKRYCYDEKMRPLAFVDAVGNRGTLEYDGQDHVVRRTTPKGEITQYVYDGDNHLTQTTEAVGVVGQERASYRYYEDTAKHLTRARDFRGKDTIYTYNNQHQLTSIQRPMVNDNLLDIVRFGYFASDGASWKAGNLQYSDDQEGYRAYFE